MTGPFRAEGGIVYDREDRVVLVTGAGTPDSWAARVASDLNLADSVASEPNIDVTLAIHRRDAGATIRASVEAMSVLSPREIHEAIARAKAPKGPVSHLRLLAADEVPS